jgi:outer membrane protein OmpA-like peptidoglycan-associated protein
MGSSWLAALLAVVTVAWAAPQVAAAQVTVSGVITQRVGDKITVRGATGEDTVIQLTPATKVRAKAGALKLQSLDKTERELIKGLPVTVETTLNGEVIEATSVTYNAGDSKTARQVEAGTAQLEAENKELRKRMSEATEYAEKASVTVYFDTGKYTLSAKSKADLDGIAQKALATKGYYVGVIGYADPTGNAEANQRLSARRALAVRTYLQKTGGIQPSRVVAPTAMGEDKVSGDTSTPEGLAANRKVVVKVLVNKGLEGL